MSFQGPSFLSRFDQDRAFWIIVGVIILAYALLQTESVIQIAVTLVALLIAVTVHECSHAWSALRLGDDTASTRGRISLNPVVHLDPLGTLMMIVTTLTGLGIGWGKPVPVNPRRLRFGPRLGNGIVALSGPISNVVAAILFGIAARGVALMPVSWSLLDFFLQRVVLINLVIAFFNLLPLPPLDGHSVLLGLLSLSRSRWATQAADAVAGLSRFGPMLLIGFLILSQFAGLNIIGRVVGRPAYYFYRVIMTSLR